MGNEIKNKIIFLDTETTDASEFPWMIQLWYIVCDLEFNEIKRENMYFNTDKYLTIKSISIHHITPKILATKILDDWRTLELKIKTIQEDFKNAYLIAHNSEFDQRVLTCNGIETDNDAWIDSYNIAYHLFVEDLEEEEMKYWLQFIRYFLECEIDEKINPHDAISDVIVLKEVFKKMFYKFSNDCVKSTNTELLEEMVTQTEKWIILRKWFFWKYKWRTFEETFKYDSSYFHWLYNEKLREWTINDAMFNTLKFYLQKL